MASIPREIQFYILVCQVNSLCWTVYRMNKVCSTSHGIERKTSSITEHIQDITSFCISLQQMAVLTLINKETRFLSFQPVYVELQSIFHCYIFRTSSLDKPILRRQQISLKRQCCFRLIVNIFNHISHYFWQSIGYFHAIYMHSCRMCLHNSCMIININDQSRQIVPLTMHQTIRIVLRISNQS